MQRRPVAMLIACFVGPPDQGEEAVRELRSFAAPGADEIRPIPYIVLQSLIDNAWGPGARNYFKSGYFDTVSNDAIEQLLRAHVDMSSPKAEIHFHHFGGAAARIARDETAFGERSSYVLNLCNRWLNPDETEEHIDWARTAYERLSPFLTGGVYVNFLADEGANQAKAAYGDKYGRLVEVKNRYDPTNVFRLNQNITPSQL
jgi:Berberine and berberine like